MKIQKTHRVGKYVRGTLLSGKYKTYIPKNLQVKPEVNLRPFHSLLQEANIALGKLDGIGEILPHSDFLMEIYSKKEAVFSSQIEGTTSTLTDLLTFETSKYSKTKIQSKLQQEDADEVSRYVIATKFAVDKMKKIPLSIRLLKNVHGHLMQYKDGKNKRPGEFRKIQNWIGDIKIERATFVPPPPHQISSAMHNLEKFLHDKYDFMPTLVKAAIAHVQFETIHPFLDGNGRVGRILISLILINDKILKEPILFLSNFFKDNRQHYYKLLNEVNKNGDWEKWIEFFLEGVVQTANAGIATAQSALKLFERNDIKIRKSDNTTSSMLLLHQYMQKNPLANTKKIERDCNIALPTIMRGMERLQRVGIVKEVTGKGRHKLFKYIKLLKLVEQI